VPPFFGAPSKEMIVAFAVAPSRLKEVTAARVFNFIGHLSIIAKVSFTEKIHHLVPSNLYAYIFLLYFSLR
jgi:hypothetical protein